MTRKQKTKRRERLIRIALFTLLAYAATVGQFGPTLFFIAPLIYCYTTQ